MSVEDRREKMIMWTLWSHECHWVLQQLHVWDPCLMTLYTTQHLKYICIAPYYKQPTSKALRYGNALSRDLTVLLAHPHVYPQTEWTIPAFVSQPKLVLIYRPRTDGRLSWPGQPGRWVNSRPRTATQCLSQLLTGRSITPHWARWWYMLLLLLMMMMMMIRMLMLTMLILTAAATGAERQNQSTK